ncbi:mediator complex subunit 23 [Oratosquilla oratoria]|uniref:mediator complex subunit 23 n=1 Tax=Oratosquilla oratoria TaxID=337810 RepID=UPI003F7690FD
MTEQKVTDVLNDMLKVDAVQEALVNLLDYGGGEKDKDRIASVTTEIQEILNDGAQDASNITGTTGSDSNLQSQGSQKNQDGNKGQSTPSNSENLQRVQEGAVRAIVAVMGRQNNAFKADMLSQILHNLISAGSVTPKQVCVALLANEHLTHDYDVFWMTSFVLIKKVISGVDYKGVREIMKMCLEKAKFLPPNIKCSQIPLINALCEVLELIFDRNASLLPGYFIVNEILKLYPDYKSWPHWRLGGLLTDFVDKFRRAAQMLTIVGRPKLRPIVEHSGHSNPSMHTWKLDNTSLRFQLKGSLPYDPKLTEPQPELLRYVLKQKYSREMVCFIIDIQKKNKVRCPPLEDQLVELMVSAMEGCGNSSLVQPGGTNGSSSNTVDNTCSCAHLSSLLIYFVLVQLISFPHLVRALSDKLKSKGSKKGRDHLMWVLLQFLSVPLSSSDFPPVLHLIELLYPEREPLPAPDYTVPECALKMAAMCILMHILKKVPQTENLKLPRTIPHVFKNQNEFLQTLAHNPQVTHMPPIPPATPDYRIALLLNAYSTNQDYFQRPSFALLESIQGTNTKSTTPMPGTNCVALGSTTPLSMTLLDSLTVHVKMSLIHHITQHISKQAQHKASLALAPALVETYARLLVYTEIESIGIKTFISQLCPSVYKSQSWGILHALLEMIIYRIHHIQPQFRIQLLSHIHHMAAMPLATMTQLHLCMETVALRLITGLGNAEVMPSLTRCLSPEAKPNLISSDSEELNRVLVLTMARAMHITGGENIGESSRWCPDILKVVMMHTPHTWANHTLQCFPPPIADFYHKYPTPRENMHTLKKAVEEEYRKWVSMSIENDIIAHFSMQHGTPPLFLCLLFKMVLETDRVPPIAYKVLERVGPKLLAAHVRTLCDFLVLEFSNSAGGHHVNKCVDTMNAIIWKYNIVPIDRLMLCLALRTHEGNEAQVCFFIIQLLLLKPPEFRNQVQDFVEDNSPEHWKQTNWHESHIAFHRKYPEKFSPESVLAEQSGMGSQYQTLPIYFGNVCLRFLPVLDIIIHRFLELLPVHKSLDTILERLGMLYKFHDRPITFLYNTLHYYEAKVRERPNLKKRLVTAIIKSQMPFRPHGWALTEAYQNYLVKEDVAWNPSLSYYTLLVRRLVQTLQGKSVFPQMEWRFNEFANAGAHALHVTCAELMALPTNPNLVANALVDVVMRGYCDIPPEELEEWINAVGLILTWLPEPYWIVIHDRIEEMLQKPDLVAPVPGSLDPFTLLNMSMLAPTMSDTSVALTLALVHSFLHHAAFGQVGSIPTLVKERLINLLVSEEQLIVVFHIVGPFLQRFNTEQTRKVFDVTIELYNALAKVDRTVTELKYMDPICDMLYHIKYMFTGDSIKTDVGTIIRTLRPALQLRLRFITHLNIENIESATSGNTPSSNATTTSSSTSSTAQSTTTTTTTTTSLATSAVASSTSTTAAAGATPVPSSVSSTSAAAISSSLNVGGVGLGNTGPASSLASLLHDSSPVSSTKIV